MRHWIQIQLTQNWPLWRERSVGPMDSHAIRHPTETWQRTPCSRPGRAHVREVVWEVKSWGQDWMGPSYCQGQCGGSSLCHLRMSSGSGCYGHESWAMPLLMIPLPADGPGVVRLSLECACEHFFFYNMTMHPIVTFPHFILWNSMPPLHSLAPNLGSPDTVSLDSGNQN